MPKPRKPAAKVVRDHEPTALAKVDPAALDTPVPFVIPAIGGLLADIKVIAGQELRAMRAGAIDDPSGQKLRNLAATLATVHETEQKVSEEDLTMTSEQLAERLEAEAKRLRGQR